MIYPIQPRDIKAFDPVVKYGHFILTTGLHSNTYINKDAMALYPRLFELILTRFSAAAQKIHDAYDVIVSPAVAGIPFGSPLANIRKKVFIYPEKKDGKMVFREVFQEYLKGKRVLVIEDIVTTGGSILKTADAIVDCGGDYIGSFCIWNRDPHHVDPALNILYSIVEQTIKAHMPDECPECAQGLHLIHPKTGDIIK